MINTLTVLKSSQVVVEQVVGQRDVLFVPALPVASLVTGDQQNGLPLGIEGEQDPKLRAA
ncbi:hypothetical protein BJY21_002335 [Kineosphaera limosa]|nr:hypothetical protein [Kineosphaera limosa]